MDKIKKTRADTARREKSNLVKLAGRVLILSTAISLLFVGLVINLIQLLLLLTIRLSDNKRWRQWHKRMSGNLIYLLYTQPIFLIYYWTDMRVSIALDDRQLLEDCKKPILGILLPNHSYELDWLTCFVLADQLGNIGAYKSFSKNELKYLPIIGWSFWMADLIFVKRDWQQDRLNIDKKLDELLDYEQILLGIFAEGTRFTDEKYRASVEVSRKRGFKPLKYHLYPRPRGFNYTMRHYLHRSLVERATGDKSVRVFNMEIVMPDRPKFSDFLNGRQLRADVYCEEVHLEPKLVAKILESRDGCCPEASQLLEDVFRRKDELIDEYISAGCQFDMSKRPNGGYFPYEKPWRPYVYWLAGMTLTYGSLAYLGATIFAESITFWALIVTVISSGWLMLRRIASESTPRGLSIVTSDIGTMGSHDGARTPPTEASDNCVCNGGGGASDQVDEQSHRETAAAATTSGGQTEAAAKSSIGHHHHHHSNGGPQVGEVKDDDSLQDYILDEIRRSSPA